MVIFQRGRFPVSVPRRFGPGRVGGIYPVYTSHIPVILVMPEFGVRKQCIFLSVYASIIVLCALTMSSQQSGSIGATKTTRFVCTSCEKRGVHAFFVDARAAHIHMARSKRCHGAEVKKITVMTRPGDVIAGGSGGMGPCPPPQHQPPGLNQGYSCHIFII
jgi:hypothetical protein